MAIVAGATTESRDTESRPLGTRAWLAASTSTLLIGAPLTWVLTGRPQAVGIDDANITMVFASNLARGYGYVFSPGQERVEGSTSILWIAIVAFLYYISETAELLMVLFGVGCTMITRFSPCSRFLTGRCWPSATFP